MNTLFLEDLKNMTEIDVKHHIVTEYTVDEKTVDKFDILVAYESVGHWGCDSSSYYLLRNKTDGELHEVHGSHCSCYGFEGQFEPEETSIEYLKSDRFRFYTGGYDDNGKENTAMVLDFMRGLNQ